MVGVRNTKVINELMTRDLLKVALTNISEVIQMNENGLLSTVADVSPFSNKLLSTITGVEPSNDKVVEVQAGSYRNIDFTIKEGVIDKDFLVSTEDGIILGIFNADAIASYLYN